MLECFNKLKIQTTLIFKKEEKIKEFSKEKQSLENELKSLKK